MAENDIGFEPVEDRTELLLLSRIVLNAPSAHDVFPEVGED